MFEMFSEPDSFKGVVQHNCVEALAWSNGRPGSTRLKLISPNGAGSHETVGQLDGACNEETRIMLDQVYASMEVDTENPRFLEIGSAENPKYHQTYRYLVSDKFGVAFTERYYWHEDGEHFSVTAQSSVGFNMGARHIMDTNLNALAN